MGWVIGFHNGLYHRGSNVDLRLINEGQDSSEMRQIIHRLPLIILVELSPENIQHSRNNRKRFSFMFFAKNKYCALLKTCSTSTVVSHLSEIKIIRWIFLRQIWAVKRRSRAALEPVLTQPHFLFLINYSSAEGITSKWHKNFFRVMSKCKLHF